MRVPNLIIDFGKHRDKAVSTVAAEDPQYLRWMATLDNVRRNRLLWRAVRAHLLLQLQCEIDAERFGDLA